MGYKLIQIMPVQEDSIHALFRCEEVQENGVNVFEVPVRFMALVEPQNSDREVWHFVTDAEGGSYPVQDDAAFLGLSFDKE